MDSMNLLICRSNNNQDCGFSVMPRRMNVALTRAKKCLLIVGSMDTMCSNTMWNKLIQEETSIIENDLGLISRIDFPNFQVVDEFQLKFEIDLTPMVNLKIGRLIGAKEGVGKV